MRIWEDVSDSHLGHTLYGYKKTVPRIRFVNHTKTLLEWVPIMWNWTIYQYIVPLKQNKWISSFWNNKTKRDDLLGVLSMPPMLRCKWKHRCIKPVLFSVNLEILASVLYWGFWRFDNKRRCSSPPRRVFLFRVTGAVNQPILISANFFHSPNHQSLKPPSPGAPAPN